MNTAYFHTNEFLVLLVIISLLIGIFLSRLIVSIPKGMEDGWRKEYEDAESMPPLIHSQSVFTKMLVLVVTLISFSLVYLKVNTYFDLVIWLVFVSGLIALAFIDYKYHLLPDQITMPFLWLGLLVNITGHIVPLKDAVLGAVFGYLVLFLGSQLYQLVRKNHGMGHGDFKLLAAIGAWLGWQSLHYIWLYSFLMFAISSLWLIGSKKYSADSIVPFGPYLIFATMIVLFFNQPFTL